MILISTGLQKIEKCLWQMPLESSLTDAIARQLDKAGIFYDRESALGGIRPDFVVHGPNDGVIVIEAKEWNPYAGYTQRAARQAHYFTDGLGANDALIVLPELQRNLSSKGVVNLDGVLPAIEASIHEMESRPSEKKPDLYTTDRIIFAAMPFNEIYDDTYGVAMAKAAEKVTAVCERVDHINFSGDIVQKIRDMIDDAVAVIVDLSESRPNVLYEAGYAHGQNRPTIQICSTPLDELPFNVRNIRTIPYKIGGTLRLKSKLVKELKAVVQ